MGVREVSFHTVSACRITLFINIVATDLRLYKSIVVIIYVYSRKNRYLRVFGIHLI